MPKIAVQMEHFRPSCIKGVGGSVKCPSCKGFSIKYGLNKVRKQRYRCKDCSRTFLLLYQREAYRCRTNEKIIKHLKQSCSISNISRLIRISKQTVLARIQSIANAINTPPIQFGMTYEVDEQWTYIQNKRSSIWIIYAFCRETKKVTSFSVGSRSNVHISNVIYPILSSNPARIYTDKLANYRTLIPKCIHSTKRGSTNHIERQNLQNRIDLKRLNRATICYSKSVAMLIACLKIYFWA